VHLVDLSDKFRIDLIPLCRVIHFTKILFSNGGIEKFSTCQMKIIDVFLIKQVK